MLISCNKLKEHIKNSNDIDWLNIWDKFTIRCAEVEGITDKGKDLQDVVVVEITKCENHPTKEKYHILEVSDGTKTYHILCGAPNVKIGLKCFLVKVGGKVSGITIEEKKIAGVLSEGMLCAGDELGISDSHEGLFELPSDTELGLDIKDLLPVEDIIVEIDNKSLTNRPDLWGHYGIAREIAAITNHELLPLPILEIENNQKDLDIVIKNQDLCKRYCGLTIDNITNNTTPIEMQIFLKYTGMRSISLIVDLTNYVMLELGAPMHAFDKRIVKNIVVDNASDNTKFITLDGMERTLNKDNLVIKNGSEISAIAGVMGGMDSEIKEDTTSIFLESANFDSTSVRKTAISLGLRTEASARYEKSLDPEICPQALKRITYLLKKYNPNLVVSSNLTDIYPHPFIPFKVTLTKQKLTTYMGFTLASDFVIKTLENLSFKVEEKEDKYIVTVPSYRATKDISLDADLIEEIARMYGYENIKPEPLKLPLTFKVHEHIWDDEYAIKEFLTSHYNASEVHSYLWYDNEFLKENDLHPKNITVVNKADNNILRENLSLSLIPFVQKNFKNYSKFIIYEIGTVIINGENKRHLSVILASSDELLQASYEQAKKIVEELFLQQKNQIVTFESTNTESYNNEKYAKDIIVDKINVGKLNVINNKMSNNIAKKKSIVTIEIDFDKYETIPKQAITLKEVNKYQETTLDYTIITEKNCTYKDVETIVTSFKNEYIKSFKLIDIYEDIENLKYSFRFIVGSDEKTLSSKELDNIQKTFKQHLANNNLKIVE